ncbi:unnamed protein product [Camellia sinensis]
MNLLIATKQWCLQISMGQGLDLVSELVAVSASAGASEGMPLNFLGLGAVEAVELGSALDGDLGQLLVVSIGHLGSHFKELILTMRVKLMVRSPPIHQETNNVICRCNDSIPVVSMEKEVTVQHLDAWFGKG